MLNKKLLLAATLSVGLLVASLPASAAAPGFYVGGQAGWGVTHYDKGDFTAYADDITITPHSVDDDGVAGRLFAGYQFDPNWAMEFGYTKFSNTKAKFNNSAVIGSDTYAANGSFTIKEHAFDLVGKGILPLENNFSVYAKLGVAYITQDTSGSVTFTQNGQTLFDGAASGDTEHKLYPTFTAGLSYDITPNVPFDISWNRIQKIGNGDIHSTDFFSIGVAYNFG